MFFSGLLKLLKDNYIRYIINRMNNSIDKLKKKSQGDACMKNKQINMCCVYDFTASMDKNESVTEIKEILNDLCKKWCFKGEIGEKGYRHWQGRLSLKVKNRLLPTIKLFQAKDCTWNISLTSNENKDNTFYIEKSDTQITQIYRDDDEVIYIPRQIREIKELYPWQNTVIEISKEWNKRTINIIYCPQGNIGKTTLVGYVRAYKLGRCLPCVFDYKELMAVVCDLPTDSAYFIDMPRAIKKNQLEGFFSGCETIKDGYAYDLRYKFQEKIFDCPNIFVFTNKVPEVSYLSEDRWNIWIIDVNKQLVKYDPVAECDIDCDIDSD